MDNHRSTPLLIAFLEGKMSKVLYVDISKIYDEKQREEVEEGYHKFEDIYRRILYELKIQELAEKGFIRIAKRKNIKWCIPPKFPGKPLSEYLKEIRE